MVTFVSSARTVDLLGRQQIAGVSTAISEVFKNAHDAYASRVQIDLIPEASAALVRDDGLGMTREAFVSRWLTLATSKEGESATLQPPPGLTKRPILGAKGIGRLAIATVGPHVLVLTKAAGSPLVMAFVNWNAFGFPGLNLSDIEIPIQTFVDEWPSSDDVEQLIAQSADNLRSALMGRSRFDEAQNLSDVGHALESLDRFNINAFSSLTTAPGPSLTSDDAGTEFLISPLGDEITDDLALHTTDTLDLTTELLGFSNSAVPGARRSHIETALVVHMHDESVDVLDASSFITPEEFNACDHKVRGQFDEEGVFRGTVSIFGGKEKSYTVRWKDSDGRSIARSPKCGTFAFDLAVIQGNANESQLSPGDHKALTNRLEKLGGVYVYNHDIRVLPYGRPDVDWLGIEQRRTKNLAKAYFSHRRMFGAVTIENPDGSGLVEKAGREGFQKNAAFRDFRAILQRFLETLAADYFVRGGLHADTWDEGKGSLKKNVEEAKKRESEKKELLKARSDFQELVAKKYVEIRDGHAETTVKSIVHDLERSIRDIDRGDIDESPDIAFARASSHLLDLAESLHVELPPGLGPTHNIKRDLSELQRAHTDFEQEVLLPARRRMRDVAATHAPETPTVDSIAKDLRPSETRGRKAVGSEAEAVRLSLKRLEQRSQALSDEVTAFVDEGVAATLADVNRSLTEDVVSDYVALQAEYEARLQSLFGEAAQALAGFKAAIDSVSWERLSDGFWTTSTGHAQDQFDIDALTESIAESADLVLQGMTLAIVDHEFNLVVRGLRRALGEVQAWARLNPELQPSVNKVTSSFEQLDGFLGVFAPLRRTATRRKELITGLDLQRYLNSIFLDRAEATETSLEYSEEFTNHRFRGHRSIWYPVLVNLVDNAMYWVQEADEKRIVRLDIQEEALLVSDTGPGVDKSDETRIWESRYSRKPGGSGLGLTISREALGDEGFTIDLAKTANQGATFTIRPLTQDELDE